MLDNVSDDFRAFLLEIFELRYKKCSTILCTQAKVEAWHVKLGGDTTAEAIIDRIVHNATNIQIGDINMRKKDKVIDRHTAVSLDYIGGIIPLYCRYHCVILPVTIDYNNHKGVRRSKTSVMDVFRCVK